MYMYMDCNNIVCSPMGLDFGLSVEISIALCDLPLCSYPKTKEGRGIHNEAIRLHGIPHRVLPTAGPRESPADEIDSICIVLM
jgi:hypothetical protein